MTMVDEERHRPLLIAISGPMRRIRLLLFIGVITGCAAVVGSAWAFFTATGSGHGAAAVGSMSAPTNVAASVPNASLRTVHVTWVTPTTPDNSTPTGFTLAR